MLRPLARKRPRWLFLLLGLLPIFLFLGIIWWLAGADGSGEVEYRRAPEPPGQVGAQGLAASAEASAGAAVDLTVSLESCSWTPVFGPGHGLGACRSGSAAAGLNCIDNSCSSWQIYCCPYRPLSDPGAEQVLSAWFPSNTTPRANQLEGAFLDGLEEGDQNQKRVRYLVSQSLEKLECRRVDGSPQTPVACNADEFVASLSCDNSLCNRWSVHCCRATVISPD